MTAGNFNRSIAEILKWEGGYVDHPKDPGGATNLGITIGTLSRFRGRKATKADVAALSRTEAIRIYRRFYADPVHFDELPAGLDHVTLDPTINSGETRGVRWLQQALGLGPADCDGRMGPKTIAVTETADPRRVIPEACRRRMGFLRGLRTWTTFGKGWSRRVAACEAFAMMLAAEAAGRGVKQAMQAGADGADAQARKDARGATVTATGGTGGALLPDMSEWAMGALVVAVIVALVVLIGRRRHEKTRAAAYRALMES